MKRRYSQSTSTTPLLTSSKSLKKSNDRPKISQELKEEIRGLLIKASGNKGMRTKIKEESKLVSALDLTKYDQKQQREESLIGVCKLGQHIIKNYNTNTCFICVGRSPTPIAAYLMLKTPYVINLPFSEARVKDANGNRIEPSEMSDIQKNRIKIHFDRIFGRNVRYEDAREGYEYEDARERYEYEITDVDLNQPFKNNMIFNKRIIIIDFSTTGESIYTMHHFLKSYFSEEQFPPKSIEAISILVDQSHYNSFVIGPFKDYISNQLDYKVHNIIIEDILNLSFYDKITQGLKRILRFDQTINTDLNQIKNSTRSVFLNQGFDSDSSYLSAPILSGTNPKRYIKENIGEDFHALQEEIKAIEKFYF